MADPIVLTAAFIEAGIRERVKEKTLEEQAEIVMRAAHDESYTFMLTSDDQRIRAGIGALLILTQDRPDDFARVEHEMKTLVAFSRMLSNRRFDTDEIERLGGHGTPKPLGLIKMFRDSKKP